MYFSDVLIDTAVFLTSTYKLIIFIFFQDRDNNMNLVHMLESFTFRNHVCMTFELLSMNLYELIKKNRFQVRTIPNIYFFLQENPENQRFISVYKNQIKGRN